jgi:CheY-like chemotaxis protein
MDGRPILVAGDEVIPSTIEPTLADEGYPVVSAPDGATALDLVERQPPALSAAPLRRDGDQVPGAS